MKGRIAEIFPSIQGEGIYCGVRQIFVRFYGCNLRCDFCDTKIEKFKEYEPDKFLAEIKSHGKDFHSVSFTGGEPLLQKGFLKEALRLVRREEYKTYLETNATLPEALEDVIPEVDIIAMDIKLPSSTRIRLDYWQRHYDFLKLGSSKDIFIKAIICLSTTRHDILTMLQLLKSLNYAGVLVLQPNSFEEYPALQEKMEMFKDICARHGVCARIIPQMHKILGVK